MLYSFWQIRGDNRAKILQQPANILALCPLNRARCNKYSGRPEKQNKLKSWQIFNAYTQDK